MSTWQNVGVILAVLAAGLGLLGALCAGSVKAARFAGKVGRLVDQVIGYGEGPTRVPGLVERVTKLQTELGELKREVKPNGGTSLRDAVDRLENRLDEIAQNTKQSEGP